MFLCFSLVEVFICVDVEDFWRSTYRYQYGVLRSYCFCMGFSWYMSVSLGYTASKLCVEGVCLVHVSVSVNFSKLLLSVHGVFVMFYSFS